MTPPRIINEWDIEVLEEPDGDIVEHDFCGAGSPFPGFGDSTHRIVLVHDIWLGDDLIDRSWAYLKGNLLPARFGYPTSAGGEYDQRGPVVPQKYHDQIARYVRRNTKLTGLPKARGVAR